MKNTGKVKNVKRRGMYTSPEVQARVRAKRLKGHTKKAIMDSENLSYPTVRKILKDTEAIEAVEQTNRDFKALGELSVKVLLKQLVKKDDVQLARQILASLGVMTTQQDRTARAEDGLNNLPQRPINVTFDGRTVNLGPTSMGLLQHLERTDAEFVPRDKRVREIAGVKA